jgi:drug/metabolite transporter (DMT)-like permease
MLVEAVFAVIAAGLVGAISQQLRKAEPLWATALLVWAGLPGLMLLAQFAVHHLARTPHLGGGLVASFCLASFASAFTWYAMRNGAMLGGIDETSVLEDLKRLPRVSLDFLLAGPRYFRRIL